MKKYKIIAIILIILVIIFLVKRYTDFELSDITTWAIEVKDKADNYINNLDIIKKLKNIK